MSAASWSGALAIGIGWAALDARLGMNKAHAHLAHQIIMGLDGPVVITTIREIIAPKGKAVLIPAGQVHTVGPVQRLTRSVYVDPRFSGIRNDRERDQPVFLSDDLSIALQNTSDVNQARIWARMFAGRLPGSAIDARLKNVLGEVDALTSPAARARALQGRSPLLRQRMRQEAVVYP